MILRKTYDLNNMEHQNSLGRDTRKLSLINSRYTVRVVRSKSTGVSIVVDVSCNRGSAAFDVANLIGFKKAEKGDYIL